MLGPVHHHPRAREDPLYEGERIILGALEADHLDQVFGIQSMAPVTDIMAVHATRTRFAHPLAVTTFHLLRHWLYLMIGTTDQAAGWGSCGGVIGERGDKDSGKKILDLQKVKANLIRYFSPDFASSLKIEISNWAALLIHASLYWSGFTDILQTASAIFLESNFLQAFLYLV